MIWEVNSVGDIEYLKIMGIIIYIKVGDKYKIFGIFNLDFNK